MKQLARTLLLAILSLCSAADVAWATNVVPIDWTRFKPLTVVSKQFVQSRSILLHCVRYNLAWIDRTFELDRPRDAYVLTRFDEHGVRPACSVVYGMSVALKTGVYDATIVGLSEASSALIGPTLRRNQVGAPVIQLGTRKKLGRLPSGQH